ncbi:hypothetical protein OESDEN_04202 [Oesophagostomum dentatum]|uniref:Peptidase A2 domain-containing protein n=1 Tax=Oesophagostomum dentatum TaxID=61180 RepID=A0A0B1TEZ1_OESDE|nr:hypothetical protein OESDEN_04202 [Oesophagostomum dentatum]
MSKLLAGDPVAGRIRALSELNSLRPNQRIAEFYAVLKKLGKQANLECRHVGALYKVEPRRVYEEIKQLALSIEQSKLMVNARKRFEHTSRECPDRNTRVNQIKPSINQEVVDPEGWTNILKQVRSLGTSVRVQKGNEESQLSSEDLVGNRVTASVTVIGEQILGLIDTGSMISIVQRTILARAQDKGVDVTSLRLVPKSQLKPVFDASTHEMKFLEAVYLDVELKGGEKTNVPFCISCSKQNELLIGMNALRKLGVEIRIGKKPTSKGVAWIPER